MHLLSWLATLVGIGVVTMLVLPASMENAGLSVLMGYWVFGWWVYVCGEDAKRAFGG